MHLFHQAANRVGRRLSDTGPRNLSYALFTPVKPSGYYVYYLL
jgi:hypothetical protein